MKEVVGIIGGSGLYQMDGLKITEERTVRTPFGEPSDKLLIGELEGVSVAFLSRHGRGHIYNPTEVNFRANIYALKSIGTGKILAVSAVGSMKEELDRGHIVVVDQLIDRTRSRPYTFFENGIVAHVAFADPFCADLSKIVFESGRKAGAKIHNGGTYVCIEGPMFSTRAESKLFRSWGVDVIGMTCYQEAKLAREAEICYSTMALVTDYDCWHESEADVDMQGVLDTMKNNVVTAQNILRNAIPRAASMQCGCGCNSALKNSITTSRDKISAETKKRLEAITGKYLG